MRPRAWSTIRDQPYYRADAVRAGLRAAGFSLEQNFTPCRGDLLVIWNRYGGDHELAKRFEAAGAAVIVMENGYLGASYDPFAKPSDKNSDQLYAMALWHHNGAGEWPEGEPGRWRDQGIAIQPWREDGEHVLILPQRGIGPPGVAMPVDWPAQAVKLLKSLTARPLRLRTHPGNHPATKPLADDLKGAWCAVTWASSAGLKAICAGVPVFCGFSKWIGFDAAWPLGGDLEHPARSDEWRERMLDRLAWAQFSTAEIARGLPFQRLAACHESTRRPL